MSRRFDFVAGQEDAGRRIDVIVSGRCDRSRSAGGKLVRDGFVLVNGASVKPSHMVSVGERISVTTPQPTLASAQPEDIPVHLVYEDADLCVVDKPAGMATHPAPGSAHGTLVNALLAALGPLPSINGVLRAGIVHRLDKNTSGLLVVAKSDAAMRALSAAMAARAVRRRYDAVVWGVPALAIASVDAPIGRDPRSRVKFAVRDKGRAALTHYRTVETFIAPQETRSSPKRTPSFARLEITLETGRTHQIRVHCASIGHPIVGDDVYGSSRPSTGMHRQALHASLLAFSHPISGVAMSFSSPWAADFAGLVDRLRRGLLP
ncbi:MAG: RluA family pseudouridine synthase [Candidatus Eremiobacteraeota bacterium]|nr:RluA family pseudouridine synthase [Candidatus Eremiobacteraeota bacterium]MBC5826771.1 RluA family pseudouridine synthase [Candidatus Eremiobacteraeota bacterium]